MTKNNLKRNKLFKIFGIAALLTFVSAFSYWYFISSRVITTDNAYASVEPAQINSEVGGTINEVLVVDTQMVKKGDTLVILDKRDLNIALKDAIAEQNKAKAILVAANADLEKSKIEFSRRKGLVKTGAVSGDEMTNTKTGLVAAQSAKLSAEEVLIQAQTKVEKLMLDLDRTTIKSPVDGVVAKRQAQIGQRIGQGTPLMIVVPLKDMHVDANFKEDEVRKIKLGQKVKLTSDLYGSSVVYDGVVSGVSGGTGAAFSAIPAQNATGNWIKVVQRLPVRIDLKETNLEKYPLSVGLSMNVTVDIDDSN